MILGAEIIVVVVVSHVRRAVVQTEFRAWR